ncbi:hypothetical protein [Kineococcus sp. SYSU DK003]|uniref:hypothetical protein n=1 Tax=Kineococcus sp. SYSU DK003 TaxID=3383124 RepID=UPI003D7D82E9
MRGPRHTLSALSLAAACLLGACSASPAQGEVPEEEERTSPLTAYFEAFYGGDLSEAEQQARFEEENRKTEELVAQCMSEQGFEYTPNTSSSSVSFGSSEEWNPDDREWVSRYGYGLVNWPGREQAEEAPVEEEYVDPNSDYVASLTESEQVAYSEALSGPQPTEEELAAMEDGTWEWDWTKGGCYGQAQHEVQGEDPLQSEQFKGLQDEINAFYEDQPSWPGLAEVDAAWSDCMSQAGYPGFAVQFDAQNSLNEEQNAIYEAADPETGEVDEAAQDALAQKEVELALADLDCREQTDYRRKYEDVTFAQEQRFVDDHRAELEAVKAAAEQGR